MVEGGGTNENNIEGQNRGQSVEEETAEEGDQGIIEE